MSKKIKITEDQLKRLISSKEQIQEQEVETNEEIEATEEEEVDETKLPEPPSEEETKNNQVYESIRANFKRFL
jgi:hypothetical protein